MDVYVRVYCPCGGLVMEIAAGLARGKCPDCHKRVTAGRNKQGGIEIITVDIPSDKIKNLVISDN